ncbi:Hsp70 family protein (plasmid) [Cereibacter azotoformans]|uniref:Hsp70 family protein n=1 Tax=Cereibacter azotoformans TaxID=43057 RepID=UPI000E35FA48|nr:Hsp70 family protein [Cereibacter azotoformans]AXQ96193.1 Hsp70 family protein [Cereibacter sphaeroides]UIJ33152.1 Hsp70 family protein [Cereibacter azotoformans]
MNDTLALDFGTSNSAAAVLEEGRPRRICLAGEGETLPTAVFFPADGGPMRIGAAAGAALVAGDEGRYMRALKSVLGAPLLQEPRLIGRRRRRLADVVTEFLAEVKRRAEAEVGRPLPRVLSGRPVHFHPDPDRDARAEADLRACYRAAGFEEVAFLFEPEAAALASHGLGREGETGLILDIGGGTSDFTLFQGEEGRCRILASHGIRLGGTDFDRAISLSHAMPLLGSGGELRREFGPGRLPMPNDLYLDLATWEKIPFLYTRETRQAVAGLAKRAVEPGKLGRLAEVLEHELGHDLAFAVERGKIDANAGRPGAMIRMGRIERGLYAEITGASLDAALARHRDLIRDAAAETCRKAGVAPSDVAVVILVGGSSLMRLVAEEARALCPAARIESAEAFTAVVDGLALATAGR